MIMSSDISKQSTIWDKYRRKSGCERAQLELLHMYSQWFSYTYYNVSDKQGFI